MNNNLMISRAQAAALARLLHHHLAAYDESITPPDDWGEDNPHPPVREPFTGADLDILEPLVNLLEKLVAT